ncbi:hypothetical protein SPONN_1587 [uncultured Candidatus Thioglobus sp.]|nr:hypothetical protein SPONN_1587 [uncultured Candidatus Thioglobus sp.]
MSFSTASLGAKNRIVSYDMSDIIASFSLIIAIASLVVANRATNLTKNQAFG